MTLAEIATNLKDSAAKVILVFAFNAVGKTQLSVAYKDKTKLPDETHAGVYYNAYSEDLFIWDNDEENDGANKSLLVQPSSLSRFHSFLIEDKNKVCEKLMAYKPKYDFNFNAHKDPEKGIESISFFIPDSNPDANPPSIKISRGEERIFVWCFFLALFEVGGWADEQSVHFFIDDPVSSLDDHNIFITASTLFNLIEEHYERRKIIITTHHIGLFCILKDWLLKGENQHKFIIDRNDRSKDLAKTYILHNDAGVLSLEKDNKEVMLYHLQLLQVLIKARRSNDLRAFHFALLRQFLENVASFLGKGQFGYVLNRIGISKANDVANIINTLSHKKVYYYESDLLKDEPRGILENVLDKLQETYHFELHLD